MSKAQENALADALVEVSFAVTAILTGAAASEGLSLTQLRLLGILRDRTPTLSALAEHLGLDRSSVSGLIDRAEARDLVVRRPHEGDRRSHVVELTEHGRELADVLGRKVYTRIDDMVAPVSPAQRRELARLLRALGTPFG